jgi:uncharacterized protein (DUF2345 family)
MNTAKILDLATVVPLADGGAVRVEHGQVSILAPTGEVVVRYEGGTATIVAQADLVLAAPRGRVRIESGQDVEITAARDVVHHAARRVDLRAGAAAAPQLRVETERVALSTDQLEASSAKVEASLGDVNVVAGRLTTVAASITERAQRIEVAAEKLIETTRDTFREAKGLLVSRAGRVQTIVRDVFLLKTRRTTLKSSDETSVDGKKVLLG